MRRPKIAHQGAVMQVIEDRNSSSTAGLKDPEEIKDFEALKMLMMWTLKALKGIVKICNCIWLHLSQSCNKSKGRLEAFH